MFALAAAVVFLLALLKVEVSFSLLYLGLTLLALHFAFGPIVAIPTYRRDINR